MIKKLHYIKEDYSGDIEKHCLETYKRDYPDFEFMAWKPGSSPLRILYDHGGLFIGQNMLSLKRIPDFYFDKSFLVFDNALDSGLPNLNLCCYANAPNEQIFLDFMLKGVEPVLYEYGFKDYNLFGAKSSLKGYDLFLPDINLFNRINFSGFEKLSHEIYRGDDIYLMDMNIHYSTVYDKMHIHYIVVNKDTSSNKVHALCESFYNMKYEDGSRHYLLLVCNDLKRDLCSRLGEFITYKNIDDNKIGNVIVLDGVDESEVGKILTEYISRKFWRTESCERLL